MSRIRAFQLLFDSIIFGLPGLLRALAAGPATRCGEKTGVRGGEEGLAMELREFIAETLAQIIEGAANAQARAETLGGFINPADNLGQRVREKVLVPGQGPQGRVVEMVEFDVAIGVTEGSAGKAGGGLLTIVSVGMSREVSAAKQTISRVKFSVPITLPLHQPESIKAKAARLANQQSPQVT